MGETWGVGIERDVALPSDIPPAVGMPPPLEGARACAVGGGGGGGGGGVGALDTGREGGAAGGGGGGARDGVEYE